MKKTTTVTKYTAKNINKPAYIVLLMAGIYFLLTKDFSQAVTFWGLALVFDPFNVSVPFQSRPFYQQVWLMVHMNITFALFVLMLFGK